VADVAIIEKISEWEPTENGAANIHQFSEVPTRRENDIFTPRRSLKPYEYPELLEFKNAIRQSYWVHEEFETEFQADVQDFYAVLSDPERTAAKRAMLSIAQIEVNVKEFWGDVFKRMPKPEIGAVGYTFAESEVRHFDAYSHLLEILGLNQEFDQISSVGAIADRIDYLNEYTRGYKSNGEDDEYAMSILLFSIFVEHVSLFSQFLILMAFNREKGLLKGISNAVEATSKEEQIHGEFGVRLIQLIREQYPHWFGEGFTERVHQACEQAYIAEQRILDWIFENGDLDFLPRREIDAFLQQRFNRALINVEVPTLFDPDQTLLERTLWFDEEVLSSSHVDFFNKRPTSYSKHNKTFSSEDLF
jgi:ribonucleoside-diphosphate reductase beta chain